MNKHIVVWVSQLAGTRVYDVPTQVLDEFEVRTTSIQEDIESLIVDQSCAGVFFDFDYPDRRRLEMFARAIASFHSIPFIMITLQHSESLAVWSFRVGAMDYLVKPLQNSEITRCIDGLLMDAPPIFRRRNGQTPTHVNIPVPDIVPNMPNSKKQQLAPAVTYVRRNYSQRIVSDGMAKLCGMSSSHFGRAFKQAYQMTFQDFVVRYRVFQAFNALQAPDANISEIAYRVGFSDPSYFTRVFKRYVGVAPSELSAVDGYGARGTLEHEMVATDDSSTSQLVRSLSKSFGS
ncbi:MAG: helix-turn-helix domain-containing protein [Gammaproteobacteria bacterium]|nr:helix-turn-helix domain-containing protein [Gammaproteobacteria bacterium]